MTLSDLTILFLIAHLLADYHLQSERMAQDKRQSFTAVLRHSLVVVMAYAAAAALAMLYGQAATVLLAAAALWATHLLADAAKALLQRRSASSRAQGTLYLIDQAVHLALLLLIVEWAYPALTGAAPLRSSYRDILKWVLLAALITKPANVSFKVLFSRYQLPAEDGTAGETVPGAGALVGNLERLISVVFLYLGQYAALGLIYTAKSIARFKQIEQNKRFAEYYLIGTLYSILYVLLAYLLTVVVL